MELNTPKYGIRNFTHLVSLLSLLFIVATATYSAQAAAHNTKPDVIYGDDDRKDLYNITDQSWFNLSRSTVALFQKHRVTVTGNTAQLLTTTHGEESNLCTDEPFWNQGAGAFCSGTLVGPDLVLTAGHCITNNSDCRGTTLVFDFAVFDQGHQHVNQVPASSVYTCKNIVQQRLEGTGEDWALIKLNRPVTDRPPLAISRTNRLENGLQLVLIGHPSGLPTKVAAGAWVRNNSNPYFIFANTDSYGGNSGSGVFNAQTGELEGVLVRGHDDYEQRPNENCIQSVRCTNDGCNGEEITRVSLAAQYIPETTPSNPGQDPIWTPTPDPGFGGGNPVPNPGWGWIP